MTRFMSAAQIEARVGERIQEYERRFGVLEHPPVPLDRLIDEVFDLRILWDRISDEGGLSPLAGLEPAERRIVVNEDRRATFDEYQGLLSFTLGHELGHWDLHVDQASLNHPKLDGFEASSVFRVHRTTNGFVEVLASRLHRMGLSKDEVHEVIHEATRGEDSYAEAWQVNEYAAALLMPRDLVLRAIEGVDLTSWPVLYRLRDAFGVSISALRVRLEKMNLIYVADDGSIHHSAAEYHGQGRLF